MSRCSERVPLHVVQGLVFGLLPGVGRVFRRRVVGYSYGMRTGPREPGLSSVPVPEPADEVHVFDALPAEAARLGFDLVSRQTETDQTVWEWRQGDGPRPQFVTERVARQWMSEWLARHPAVVEPDPLDEHRRAREGGAERTPVTVAESA